MGAANADAGDVAAGRAADTAVDTDAAAAAAAVADDERVLASLGYRQVLARTWGTLTTVALTISAMSVLTSVTASFGTGLFYGGPAVCVWGWLAVSAATLAMGLGMAELASAYPTSGGMYYWQYKLAGRRFGPWCCWVTGWLNLLGQIAAISAVAALAADLITTMARMATALDGGTPVEIDKYGYFGIFAGVIVATAALNSLGVRWLATITQVGAAFNIAGVVLLCLVLPLVAPKRQSARYVFTSFEPQHAEARGITNPFYIAVLGLLLPAYSYTGVDGPVHMSEEVVGSRLAPPVAILAGIGVMFAGGGGMVLALLFSMESSARALAEDGEAKGNAVAQILHDAFLARFGSARAGVALQAVPIGGVFFCLVATTTYVARIAFCYSRDRAVPLSHLWERVDARTKLPMNALWAVCALAIALGLPILGSETAFAAILSLSTVSLIVAYAAPILVRVTVGRKRFVPGPFSLGAWAYPIGAVAVAWAALATAIFVLPTELPVAPDTLNYASVALGGTFLLSNLWFFFPKYGAYKWFTGPHRTVDDTAGGGGAPASAGAAKGGGNGGVGDGGAAAGSKDVEAM